MLDICASNANANHSTCDEYTVPIGNADSHKHSQTNIYAQAKRYTERRCHGNLHKLFSKVQGFNDEGLIPSTKGTYRKLEDFDEQLAQIGWLRFMYLPITLEHFVFNANVQWQTAVDTADISGCGIVFGIENKGDNYEYYGVVLDKSRIFFSIARSGYYYELGKTRGTGRLDYGNPADVELTLLVYNNHAFVYVDDNFIGEYTLSESKELRGNFGYGIISGTNKDYGTACRITNARAWQLTE